MPARGPEPSQREVAGDLRQRDGDDLQRARQLDQCVAAGLRLEAIVRRSDLLELRLGDQLAADAGGELRVRVQPGARGGAAERDLADVHERGLDALLAEADLRGVAGELLAERHGHGVHQVRAAGLHDVLELAGLLGERALEQLQRGERAVDGDVERGQVHGGREDVVRRLAHVHVIVRVSGATGEARDHLVGVHVRRGARAGLEDVDRELRVMLAGGDRGTGVGDLLRELGVEQTELAVHHGGCALDAAEPVDDLGGHGLAGDLEVRDRLGGLTAVEALGHAWDS